MAAWISPTRRSPTPRTTWRPSRNSRVRTPYTPINAPGFFRGGLQEALTGLKSAESWALADLEALQRTGLNALFSWSRRQAPWYQESRWRAARLPGPDATPAEFAAAWSALPILTKAELREHGAALNARGLSGSEGPFTTARTSGSVGIPVAVRTSRTSRLVWNALTVREHLWSRRDFGKRLGIIRSRHREGRVTGGEDLPSWGPPVSDLWVTGPASVIHIGFPVEELVAWLRRFDPHYLLTYPSTGAALFEVLGATGKPAALEEIRFMSEPLDPELEAALVKDWGVRVTDLYSANEVGHIAFRCRESGRLHVQAEAILVEVLRDDGRPCDAGETGRVVVTALHNQATPLLRYELGDFATVGARCGCGRQHPVLERVQGRVRNLLRTPDGRRSWPAGLGRLRKVPVIAQAQYVQTTLDTIELRIVADRELTPAETAACKDIARHALGYPFRIVTTRVAEIPRGPTGKFEEFLSLLA